MARLKAPADGVTIRMFRQGHGDCFLLAFPRPNGQPYYVLIDCGMKPGSQNFLAHKKALKDIVTEDLHEACGGHLDLVILTHEHQDHLNGIWSKNDPPFGGFEIDECWVGWTEDPENDLANKLRQRHKDQLLGLIEARQQLALAVGGDTPTVQRLDQMLAFELGGDGAAMGLDEMRAAAADPEKSVNKQGLKLVQDKAMQKRGAFVLYPGGKPIAMTGTTGVKAFVFGPPEDEELIADEDPQGDEAFPREHSFSFGEAIRAPQDQKASPFRRHYSVTAADGCGEPSSFFAQHYGNSPGEDDATDGTEVGANPKWRRIDSEWLYSSELLAIKLNKGINNTSLVLAFELPQTKKVLFFAADAQRGNWISWQDVTFTDGGATVTARDLLSRAVLYKVGHHGSHNATLDGAASDAHANLAWMAQGGHADEFVAMITAVNKWATEQNNPPWHHPLPSIKEALVKKCQGRVLQTDENGPARPGNISAAKWKLFTDRLVVDDLYFDLTIRDT